MQKLRLKSFFKVYKYVLFDAFTIVISYLFSIWMLSYVGVSHDLGQVGLALLFIVPSKIIIYTLAGIYRILTKHTGFEDMIRIVTAAILTNVLLVVANTLTGASYIEGATFVFITLIEITGLIFPRVLRRILKYMSYQLNWLNSAGLKTLIIGAGSAGEMVIKEIYKNKDLNNIPTVFVDDNHEKIGKKLMGIDIVGTLHDIPDIIKKYRIEEAVLAIKDLPKERQTKLINELINLHVKVKRLNILEDFNENQKPELIDIKVEDLLNRDVIHLDNAGIEAFIKDEVILVTGGGGSIGSELCRQIYDLSPKVVIIFDIYENNAYDIQMELLRKQHKNPKRKYPELIVRIGSVYNKERLEDVFKAFKPTIVFHAAAYKHVPLMEDNAVEAVRTNVLGTLNTAELSNQYGVKKFVLVSSDKAVRATNIMGATKRLAELIIKHEQKHSKTSFSAVRFGNVLGSNGSVIPLFKKQIADGGPITVTHKDITRYFMTIPEAVGLILQCGVYAHSDELFILDMGEPVKIYDLAKKMIKLAGLRPGEDIKLEIIGLRPGEKLYEELLIDTQNPDLHRTENKSIFRENGEGPNLQKELLQSLLNQFENLSNDEVKETVSKLVSSYQINGHDKQ